MRTWITFRVGDPNRPEKAKKRAEQRAAKIVNDATTGEFVEPSKLTLGEWLDKWVEKAIKPPRRAQTTHDSYTRIIATHIAPAIGAIRLQGLTPLTSRTTSA